MDLLIRFLCAERGLLGAWWWSDRWKGPQRHHCGAFWPSDVNPGPVAFLHGVSSPVLVSPGANTVPLIVLGKNCWLLVFRSTASQRTRGPVHSVKTGLRPRAPELQCWPITLV